MMKAWTILTMVTLAAGGVATCLVAWVLPSRSYPILPILAGMLCWVPAWGTLVLIDIARKRSANAQLMATFAGVMIRMAVVILGGVAFHLAAPVIAREWSANWIVNQRVTFWFWLIYFYIVILVVETTLSLTVLVPPVALKDSDAHTR